MNAKTRREEKRKQNQRKKMVTTLTWGGVALAVLAIIGVMVWQGVKPAAGEEFSIMVSSPHIEEGTDPGTYNSDPPTSGPHYAEEAEAGFYDTNIYEYPAGYLVHNLEHGYIIFWYDCEALAETECSDLKTRIRAVMDDLGGTKLIAYPWSSLDVPVAVTSWGRMQTFETFDEEQAKAFYRANLNRAPEPNAP